MRKQLHGLQETNRYLKTQIRDNQRDLHAVKEHERQKANDEIARMRDSMMSVLARERELMKAHIKKTSEKMKSLLAESIEED